MKLISYLVAGAMMIVGDRIVAKWVAEFRAWYDQLQDENFKKKCDEEYNRLSKIWNDFKKDQI